MAGASVPQITVVLRKGYGAGSYVMNGRACQPDLIVGWPTGRSGWSFRDDPLDPAETRRSIVRGVELCETKKVEWPWRKHGVLPV